MDSLTQAVLGAALQGAVLGRIQGRRSLLYGAALGTLPDLDVLIRYADPVSQMTYHRGFSHSLFVLTALAAALAWLVSAVARRRWPDKGYRLPRVFLAFWLVLVTHPILDAFTVYGTQLFWPLHLTPQSWAAVFIIDPVYTLPLLGAVLYAAFKGMSGKAVTVLGVALAFSTAYLGYGLAGRMAAEQRFALALDEHHKNKIAVVLSGSGKDGSEGARSIKKAGGKIIVQSLDTCQFTELPGHVLKLVQADFIATPQDIPSIIRTIADHPQSSAISPLSPPKR